MENYEPIQIEYGDGLHFFRITPQGLWMWKHKLDKNIELIFGVNMPDGVIDSTPFYVKNGIGSFKMYFHSLKEVKETLEYQLNIELPDEPFEVYESIILAQTMSGEIAQMR